MLRKLCTTIAVMAVVLSGITAHAATASLGSVAFVQNQQLWVKDIPSGKALLLDKDKDCSTPKWSADGEWLAYLSGDSLMIIHRSGKFSAKVAKVGDTPTYSWSPNVDTLAYIASDRSLRTVDFVLDRSRIKLSERKITSAGDAEATGVWSYKWGLDGKHIAYVRVDKFGKMGPGNMPGLQSSVWKINADGTEAIKLLNAGRNTYLPILAAWSPDSNWIFFWKDIMYSGSILADGVPLCRLSTSGGEAKDIVPSMLAYNDYLSFSPDGTRFAATVYGDRMEWSSKRLSIVDIQRSTKLNVTSGKDVALSPAWSPQGYEIAYVTAPDQAGVSAMSKVKFSMRKIGIINTHSWKARVITRDMAFRDESPRWSDDGDTLLIVRVGLDKKASIWMMDHNGRGQKKVISEFASSRGNYYGHTNWSEYFDWWNKKPEVKTLEAR